MSPFNTTLLNTKKEYQNKDFGDAKLKALEANHNTARSPPTAAN